MKNSPYEEGWESLMEVATPDNYNDVSTSCGYDPVSVESDVYHIGVNDARKHYEKNLSFEEKARQMLEA